MKAQDVAWPGWVSGSWLSLGLGDLLLAAVFLLVMRKAFGRTAGILAMITGICAISLLTLSVAFGLPAKAFPVMVVLGPLMVLQYFGWCRRRRNERTTREYMQAEPTE
jgi:hypothetical protein